MRRFQGAGWAVGLALLAALAQRPARAESPIRGLVPRAQGKIVLDGRLDDWKGDFSTPVNSGHADWANRAAVWHYLWDDENLYIGLECLDTVLFNKAPGPIYDGDGVEFYLDLRSGDQLGAREYTPGALHLFFTAMSNGDVKPRIQIRPGLPALKGVTTEGMEAAAQRTPTGYTLEFKLPWAKVPGFRPEPGREIGLDCELCSSDGGPRVDRCWVYSGVAAVQTPSAFGRVKLVGRWDPADAAAYSPVLFPSFLAVSTPAGEPATLFLGVSPALQPLVRRVEMTAGGKKLPFAGLKPFGPGWLRAQACLVGFLNASDRSIEVRFLGADEHVLGTRTVAIRP